MHKCKSGVVFTLGDYDYSDNSDYQTRLRKVAQQLVSERLMLPTDAKIYESFTLP
jgi:hypothetical protein